MKVIVNKKEVEIPNNYSVEELIKLQNYVGSVAVFINGRQLLLLEYNNYAIKEDDVITIFKPLGGG